MEMKKSLLIIKWRFLLEFFFLNSYLHHVSQMRDIFTWDKEWHSLECAFTIKTKKVNFYRNWFEKFVTIN